MRAGGGLATGAASEGEASEAVVGPWGGVAWSE